MAALAAETDEVDFAPWHSLQEWIALGEHSVVVPYASAFAELTKPVAVRLRRDFAAFLSLIKAHSLLHQATRDKDESGAVIATLDDYATVLDLVGSLIDQGVEVTIRRTVRETVEAVKEIIEGSGISYATVKQVADTLGIDRSAASRRVLTAQRGGLLKNIAKKKERGKKIALDDSLPENQSIFPTVAELERVCRLGKPLHSQPAQTKNEENQEDTEEVCRSASVQGGIYPQNKNISSEYCLGKYEGEEEGEKKICVYYDLKDESCHWDPDSPVPVSELEDCKDETAEFSRD